MATRHYCDNCGLTISKLVDANKYTFGPSNVPLERFSLDLCDRCKPVWMERVIKLTSHEDDPPKQITG